MSKATPKQTERTCHICYLPFTQTRPPSFDYINALNRANLEHESCNPNPTKQRVVLVWGVVPVRFKGDPHPIQPVRIVDFELAPSLHEEGALDGWYFGRYA